MSNKVVSLLTSPFPQMENPWKQTLYTALIVSIIFFLFQPFGMASISSYKYLVISGYVAVTALSTIILNYIFPILFNGYYREEGWTLGKSILNVLLLCFIITLGNTIYSIFIFGIATSWQIFMTMMLYVLITAPFPCIFITMWHRNILLTKHLKEANQLNQQLSHHSNPSDKKSEESEEDTHLTFMGNTRDTLDIPLNDLIYVESEGNYIKVTYQQDGNVHQKMIRNTLKQIEQMVEPFHHIIRCHRAFLVNTHQVVKIDGNARGYYLSLRNCTQEVPVSRAYTSIVKQNFSAQ